MNHATDSLPAPVDYGDLGWLLTSFARSPKHDAAFAQVINVLHGRASQLPKLRRSAVR